MNDIKLKIEELENEIRRLGGVFDIEAKKNRVKELEYEFSDPDFWKNKEIADAKIKEVGETISIFSGAGGQDCEDWAGMLFEMYSKFAQKRGWKTNVIDESEGELAKTATRAFKNITFEVKGPYAFGYLKKETGVHRLVRVSPYSAEDKRHTSFVLVEVLPDLPDVEGKKFQINPDDLKIDFMRAGGPGGQNVNKVETAVRITHIPTGITVASRVERSQDRNRQLAMKILKSKLIKLMEEQQAKELGELRTKIKPEWGNQIRSYVLNPYKLVKDHRNNMETTQIDKVLDGDIDIFVEAEL